VYENLCGVYATLYLLVLSCVNKLEIGLGVRFEVLSYYSLLYVFKYTDWIFGWLVLLKNVLFMIDMLGTWIMKLFFCIFKLIMATCYPISVKTKKIYRYDSMNNCLVDVCNIWLFSHGWCCLCWESTVCISDINYHGLFSSSIMEDMIFEFGVYNI